MANMIFQATWELVVSGAKTQTRRIVKPKHYGSESGLCAGNYVLVYNDIGQEMWDQIKSHHKVYEEGATYAVMPARGVRGLRKVADIQITRIRREDVREISEADAVAEGFADKLAFLRIWCSINDREAFNELVSEVTHTGLATATQQRSKREDAVLHTMNQWMHHITYRPSALYDAWCLDFRVVNVYADAVAKARELLKGAA